MEFYSKNERGPRRVGDGRRTFANRETVGRLSPMNTVERATTPTLILHGEVDDRCPIGQGEELYMGLTALGKAPAEFVRYPGGSRLFILNGRPSHRVDYNRRVVEWATRWAWREAARLRFGASLSRHFQTKHRHLNRFSRLEFLSLLEV